MESWSSTILLSSSLEPGAVLARSRGSLYLVSRLMDRCGLLCSTCSLEEATIFQQVKHKGPIRALDFSSGKKQLLASGSSDGEVRRLFQRSCRFAS